MNALLDSARHVFQLCADMVENRYMELSIDAFRNKALDALSLFEKQVKKSISNKEILADGKYIIVAYIDDVILGSDWQYKQEWSSSLLQHSLYFEHLAGERFFELLQQLQNVGASSIDLLELCYVCLQLGFKGKYRHEDPHFLRSIQSDLFVQLSALKNYSSSIRKNENIFHQHKRKNLYMLLSYRFLLGGALALITIVYFYYSFKMNYVCNSTKESIISYAETLSERT